MNDRMHSNGDLEAAISKERMMLKMMNSASSPNLVGAPPSSESLKTATNFRVSHSAEVLAELELLPDELGVDGGFQKANSTAFGEFMRLNESAKDFDQSVEKIFGNINNDNNDADVVAMPSSYAFHDDKTVKVSHNRTFQDDETIKVSHTRGEVRSDDVTVRRGSLSNRPQMDIPAVIGEDIPLEIIKPTKVRQHRRRSSWHVQRTGSIASDQTVDRRSSAILSEDLPAMIQIEKSSKGRKNRKRVNSDPSLLEKFESGVVPESIQPEVVDKFVEIATALRDVQSVSVISAASSDAGLPLPEEIAQMIDFARKARRAVNPILPEDDKISSEESEEVESSKQKRGRVKKRSSTKGRKVVDVTPPRSPMGTQRDTQDATQFRKKASLSSHDRSTRLVDEAVGLKVSTTPKRASWNGRASIVFEDITGDDSDDLLEAKMSLLDAAREAHMDDEETLKGSDNEEYSTPQELASDRAQTRTMYSHSHQAKCETEDEHAARSHPIPPQIINMSKQTRKCSSSEGDPTLLESVRPEVLSKFQEIAVALRSVETNQDTLEAELLISEKINQIIQIENSRGELPSRHEDNKKDERSSEVNEPSSKQKKKSRKRSSTSKLSSGKDQKSDYSQSALDGNDPIAAAQYIQMLEERGDLDLAEDDRTPQEGTTKTPEQSSKGRGKSSKKGGTKGRKKRSVSLVSDSVTPDLDDPMAAAQYIQMLEEQGELDLEEDDRTPQEGTAKASETSSKQGRKSSKRGSTKEGQKKSDPLLPNSTTSDIDDPTVAAKYIQMLAEQGELDWEEDVKDTIVKQSNRALTSHARSERRLVDVGQGLNPVKAQKRASWNGRSSLVEAQEDNESSVHSRGLEPASRDVKRAMLLVKHVQGVGTQSKRRASWCDDTSVTEPKTHDHPRNNQVEKSALIESTAAEVGNVDELKTVDRRSRIEEIEKSLASKIHELTDTTSVTSRPVQRRSERQMTSNPRNLSPKWIAQEVIEGEQPVKRKQRRSSWHASAASSANRLSTGSVQGSVISAPEKPLNMIKSSSSKYSQIFVMDLTDPDAPPPLGGRRMNLRSPWGKSNSNMSDDEGDDDDEIERHQGPGNKTTSTGSKKFRGRQKSRRLGWGRTLSPFRDKLVSGDRRQIRSHSPTRDQYIKVSTIDMPLYDDEMVSDEMNPVSCVQLTAMGAVATCAFANAAPTSCPLPYR